MPPMAGQTIGSFEEDLAKNESLIVGMQNEVKELSVFYTGLRARHDKTTRGITGLNSEKEDVRVRIRALLNKKTQSETPDAKEVAKLRRTSVVKTYEPIPTQKVSKGMARKLRQESIDIQESMAGEDDDASRAGSYNVSVVAAGGETQVSSAVVTVSIKQSSIEEE